MRASHSPPSSEPWGPTDQVEASENKSSFSEDSATFSIRHRSEGPAAPTEASRKQNPAQPSGAFPSEFLESKRS